MASKKITMLIFGAFLASLAPAAAEGACSSGTCGIDAVEAALEAAEEEEARATRVELLQVTNAAQREDGARVVALEEQVSRLTLEMASMQVYIAKMESGIRSAEHLAEVQTKVAVEMLANATEQREEESRGKCSSEDAAAMASKGGGHGRGSFGDLAAGCGHESFSVWSGFDQGHYNWCLRKKHDWKLSENCASCFTAGAKYSYDHCKWQCMSSWCHKDCLDCAHHYESQMKSCTGVPYPAGTAC